MGGGRTYLTRPCRASKLDEPPRLPPRATPVPGLRRKSAGGTEQLLHTSWVSLTLTEGKFRQVRLLPPASCLLPPASCLLPAAQHTHHSLRRVCPSGRAVLHAADSQCTIHAVRKMRCRLYVLWQYLLWLYLLWQVRKMTHAVGHPTLRLVRVRVAQ